MQNPVAAVLDMPANQWIKCASCRELIYRKEWDRLHRVCPLCNYHQRLRAHERIAITADEGSFTEFAAEIIAADPLGFPDCADKLDKTRRQTGLDEALLIGDATIDGLPVVLGVFDFHFFAGTMSAAIGEKVCRAMERGLERGVPVVLFIASGGARVQEGLHALMQMAATSAAVARLRAAAVPYLVVLTDPSMAGVLASFASLGDVIIAEPGAVIGFTGPRVMEQTLRIKLPAGHQTAEFQLKHGMIDQVVDRPRLKEALVGLLTWFSLARRKEG